VVDDRTPWRSHRYENGYSATRHDIRDASRTPTHTHTCTRVRGKQAQSTGLDYTLASAEQLLFWSLNRVTAQENSGLHSR